MNKESSIIKIIMLWALVIIINILTFKMEVYFKLNKIHNDIKELKVYIEEK